MRTSTIALACGTAGLIVGSLLSSASFAAGTNYGEDRAEIEDLQARYGSAKWQYKGGVNPAW